MMVVVVMVVVVVVMVVMLVDMIVESLEVLVSVSVNEYGVLVYLPLTFPQI